MPLVNGRYPVKNPNWLLAGQPTGVFRENFPRNQINTDLAALTTQVMSEVAIPLQAGDVVTNLTFKSGATAACPDMTAENEPIGWQVLDADGNVIDSGPLIALEMAADLGEPGEVTDGSD